MCRAGAKSSRATWQSGRQQQALFARAVDPDQDCCQHGRRATAHQRDGLSYQRIWLIRPQRSRCRQDRCLPVNQARIGGSTDLRIRIHPGRSRGDLRGKPCQQGHKGKENTVHRQRI